MSTEHIESADRRTAEPHAAEPRTAGRRTASRHTAGRHTAGRHTAGRHTAGRHTAGRHTVRRGQRGQALVEVLAASLVLLPLAVLVVLLGKFQSLQQATIAASRTLAFECTVRPDRCEHPATQDVLVDELRARHFGRLDREILSADRVDDRAQSADRNPLWVDRSGNALLERFADVGGAVSAQRFDAGRATAVGRSGGVVAATLLDMAGPGRFGLQIENGLIDARVQVAVSPSQAGNERLVTLDSLPLTLRARTAILTDAWEASGPYGAQAHRVQQRVERGSRLDSVRESAIAVGYDLTRWSIELMHVLGLEPAARDFELHRTDVDRVPADRLVP